MMDAKSDWIFYLKLTPKLNNKFFEIDRHFKQKGFTLIPVSVSDLIAVNRGENKFQVILIADGFEQARYYHKKIRKILKYWMRSKRINLFIGSSFELLDDSAIYGLTDCYFYYKLPIKTKEFCDKIGTKIKEKQDHDKKWPGSSTRLGSTIG
jgi:hypothetical protein